ncbi:unnamed protein product [Protopolystoma xenopodis]|uniref:DDHD domain-containing protein n=1 Tax=Protopolystoma xenopodis TaxID=117903 RepID=A0A3S5C5R7_9PLAT|nr:unnamed protein product [Protopolystoma xenopodis]
MLGRVEFLPVVWHTALHSGSPDNLDAQLARVSLRTVPRLRDCLNHCLTDVLFYTGLRYRRFVLKTVAHKITELQRRFLARNPDFVGTFSILGHSLGAVVGFDLLAAQHCGLDSNSLKPQPSHYNDSSEVACGDGESCKKKDLMVFDHPSPDRSLSKGESSSHTILNNEKSGSKPEHSAERMPSIIGQDEGSMPISNTILPWNSNDGYLGPVNATSSRRPLTTGLDPTDFCQPQNEPPPYSAAWQTGPGIPEFGRSDGAPLQTIYPLSMPFTLELDCSTTTNAGCAEAKAERGGVESRIACSYHPGNPDFAALQPCSSSCITPRKWSASHVQDR